MVAFQHRAWKLVTAYEKFVGSWPYQRNLKNNVHRICLFVILVTMMVAVCIRLVKEVGIDFFVVTENSNVTLLTIGGMVKLVMPLIYEKRRRAIYEQVVKHVDFIKDDNEVLVLQRFSDASLRYTFIYTAVISISGLLFFILPVLKLFYNYLTGISDSKTAMPLSVDYVFLDQQEYFYYVLIHVFVYFATCIIITLAFDIAFIMGVNHVCALFEIVRMRLNKASDILNRIKRPNNFINSDNKVNSILKSAIDMHNEVLHMAALLEEAYNLSWFFVLILNTIMLGITLLVHSLGLNDPIVVLRGVMANTIFLVHFYVIFTQGQRIINSSSSVFDTCYNFTWYTAPKYSRKLLLLMMNRSFKPCMITGGNGMFILSMETYAHMLKVGFSIFTVFKSTQK